MITVKTVENLLVFSVTDTITANDVDQIYDIMVKKLSEGGSINIYAELQGKFSIEGRALIKDLVRAHEVLGKMKQFDRIAFVASSSWIRAIASIEAAAFSLTSINLHVYDPEERAYALAWAKGEVENEHASSVREIDASSPEILAFVVDGKMRTADLPAINAMLSKLSKDDGPKKILGLFKGYKGFELGLLADGSLLAGKKAAIGQIKRYAIVGAPGWIETIVEAAGKVMDTKFATFDANDEAAAWAWLEAA